ncbi:hypothetical protein Tco_1113191 [Tanacetum coccineum]|uniref:Uncharacterized protein n=1 Tax=Tanacetum coccineum TaxID=301880 RepID=A0ABQ5IUI1_9ASTR
MSGNQEQLDDFDFRKDSYATDDDELPIEKCTLGDEHQYHIDQMQNFLKNDIVWERRKEILVSPHPQKPTLKGCSGPEKIVMSLHKSPAVIFPDDDIEERTSRCVDKCVKKFNPYARYNVEIRRIHMQRSSTSRNKKSPESQRNKVDDYVKTGLLWSFSVFIRSIEKYKVFSIVFEPVYGIVYKNNKKEKRVMRHQEIHKFCDATLKRVLEGWKSYNNNVKHRYVTLSLSNEDAKYLQLFEEDIEERYVGKYLGDHLWWPVTIAYWITIVVVAGDGSHRSRDVVVAVRRSVHGSLY